MRVLEAQRYLVYLLYWYRITNTDAARQDNPQKVHILTQLCTPGLFVDATACFPHFTCVAGTKIPTLTQPCMQQRGLFVDAPAYFSEFTCFTGSKVQLLTQVRTETARPFRRRHCLLSGREALRNDIDSV